MTPKEWRRKVVQKLIQENDEMFGRVMAIVLIGFVILIIALFIP